MRVGSRAACALLMVSLLALTGCGRSSHTAKAANTNANGSPSSTTSAPASGQKASSTTKKGSPPTTGAKPSSPPTTSPVNNLPAFTQSSTPGTTAPPDPRLAALKSLPQPQLCGLLHGDEPKQLLGARTKPPVYAAGQGVACTWARTDGNGQVSVTIGNYLSWQSAQLAAAFSSPRATTVAGRPAFVVLRAGAIHDVIFVVAAGGNSDPAVQFRGPDATVVRNLANLVMPRVIALV